MADATNVVFSYSYLYRVALISLNRVEESKSEFYQLLDSIVSITFFAFSLEACLNHIGLLSFEDWESFERKNTIAKLKRIRKHYDFSFDYNKRPFKTFKHIIMLRNNIAHGKTLESFSKDISIHDHAFLSTDKNSWLNQYNLKFALIVANDVKSIFEFLNQKVTKININPSQLGTTFIDMKPEEQLCQAKTKKGLQCKNKSVFGFKYCYLHRII